MKFLLGETVWYLKDNKVHSADILSRIYVQNIHPNYNGSEEHRLTFQRFGKCRKLYSTCHGEFKENEIFLSKEELLKSL